MANIFISYNHQSKAIATTLAEDLEALGHTVWFDQDLSGGQVWWDQILTTVRDCDIFVFVVDPEALNSTACKREYGYAADLGKPILPVLVSGEVSTNLLPPALSQIQFVDYREQNRHAAFRLARALATVPPAKPLPDPLPAPPEVPISYLGSLTEQVQTTSTLSYAEQSALVVDLKRSLRDPGTARDTRTLLARLRRRRDLFATIAEEIDELLGSASEAMSAPPRAFETEPYVLKRSQQEKTPWTPAESRLSERQEPQHSATPNAPTITDHKPTREERVIGALSGAVLGTVAGMIAMSIIGGIWVFGLLTGVGGMIAGALSGTRRREIVAGLIGTASGWFLVAIFWVALFGSDIEAFAAGGVFGAPSGAILGAITGQILRKLK